ncbi:MAG TPA: hypothetical protein VFV99_20985 [Kofleriaceae bacterium]|nr:hypothetical protein [Kofleriaceae bacterium]
MFTRLVTILVLLFGLGRLGYAIELGAVTIRNSSNSSIGSVDSDGTIRNSSNSSVGKIEKDGTIRDGSNSSIGKVESDGTIRDSSNSSIGKIDSDGTIRNASNSSIGKVDGYSPRLRHLVAAVLFFGGSVSVLR